MKLTIQQYLCYLFRACLLAFFAFDMLLLGGCNDDTEMEIINSSQKNVISLSIPDAELVQVRSVANESECKISGIQVFVYNDTHISSPVYYQEGKANLSFLFGNGTASPTVTLKEYIPTDKERIYVVCNLTGRSSVSGTGDFLIDETVSEEQLRNYTSQGMMKGFSGLQSEGRTIPMYGWMEWNENATSNVCLLTRCLAKVTVDAGADLFSGKQVYWEWRNLNYSDFVLDSEYQGIYQGAINDVGISGKYDLVSATTPVDETVGLVTTYYPLEYKHSVYALGNEVDEKKFSKDRAMLLLTVQNPDGSNREYYRLDIWDKETGKYLDIVRNHSYRFNIAKVKSRGYASEQEAYQNPGSNIEYTITVTDQWSQGFVSNGQYLVKTDREKIELIESGIKDPVTMVKFELQADETGNVDLNNVTTRKVRILNSDKETLVSSSDVCLFYSVDNKNLMQVKGEDGLPINEANLPQGSNVYWIYCNVPGDSSLKEGYLEITIGNIVKYIPFSIIPHSEAIAVDEDGPANCFITPVTYGLYSFDATVMGNGADGIVAETIEYDEGNDMVEDHFKDALGNDISRSKNAIIVPRSAKLIWQDKQNLISQVAFNTVTKRVELMSNGTGNGIIAVYDKSDPNDTDANLLWSWHIWCTEVPKVIELGLPTNGETYSGRCYKILDRDLGATTVIPDELTTRGLGYQWGRKDPFINSVSFENEDNAPIYNIRGSELEFKKEKRTEAMTLEYMIQHPDVFVTGQAGHSFMDWLYNKPVNSWGNQYLWGNPYSGATITNIETLKTIYDPCPAGYKVIPQDVYAVFLKNPIIIRIDDDIVEKTRETVTGDFYPPTYTQHGVYMHYGGIDSNKKVYFIYGGSRYGRVEREQNMILSRYSGHTSATNNAYVHVSSGTKGFVVTPSFIHYQLGYIEGLEDRVSACSIRCVRDE